MSKEKNIRTIKKPDKIISYWLYQPFVCLLIFIFGITYNFGMLLGPYFQGLLIDEINDLSNTFSDILKVAVIYLITALIVQGSRAIKRYYVRRFANNAMATMRITLANNILNTPYKELNDENIGKLLTRSQSDVNEAVEGMRKLTTEIFDTIFLFIFYIIYLFFFDIKITALALISVLVAVIFAFSFRKVIYQTNKESRKQNSILSSSTYDLANNALLYRINSRDDDNLKDYDNNLKLYEKKNIKASLFADMFIPISDVIALIGLIPVLYLGIDYVKVSRPLTLSLSILEYTNWTVGSFTTYLTIFVLLAKKASHTAKLFSSVEKGLSSWKRISPYIKPYKEYTEPIVLDNKDGLVFNNVSISFDYQQLLKPFSFTAKPGEIIAITGPIASGKSAIGRIFLKEVSYSGYINLFGKNLNEYSDGEIKGNIVYMGHKHDLLSTSIKENIAFDDNKDVLPYLKLVSFDKDLNSMPDKENTLIGAEGVKLSGGQQERIALARTIYNKKDLIILDDPFASIDTKTEKEIMNNLENYINDSIILLISHRLSFFPYCNQVICLNKDKSVSVGTHKSLLENNSTYKELWNLQRKEENL